MNVYKEQKSQALSNFILVADGISVTAIRGLSLHEYIEARTAHCRAMHKECRECPQMLQVAKYVSQNGFMKLKSAFVGSFPSVEYSQVKARRRLLQMPLSCVRVDYAPGQSECFLVEYHPGVNYVNLSKLLQSVLPKSPSTVMDKPLIQSLLGLCQSDRERECVRFAVFKASGLSATQARKQFGFENMTQRTKKVEDVIAHVEYIRTAIEKLAMTKELAVLRNLGLTCNDKESSDSENEDSGSCDEDGQSLTTCEDVTPQELTSLVQESQLNWFEIAEKLENTHGHQCPHVKELSKFINSLEISMKEKEQLRISYEAFTLDEQFNLNNQREASMYNGDIVTESKSDDPDTINNSQTPLDPALKKIIEKKRTSIKRQTQRKKVKRIMEQNFLGRKTSTRVDSIVKKYPVIGDTIETFVRDNNVGAEAWRCTGMLTFDGNVKKKQKVTYERITTKRCVPEWLKHSLFNTRILASILPIL